MTHFDPIYAAPGYNEHFLKEINRQCMGKLEGNGTRCYLLTTIDRHIYRLQLLDDAKT